MSNFGPILIVVVFFIYFFSQMQLWPSSDKCWNAMGEGDRQDRLRNLQSLGFNKVLLALLCFTTNRMIIRVHDEHHSRGEELMELRSTLELLKSLPGDPAKDEAKALQKRIKEVEMTPVRESLANADDFVGQLRPDLERLHESSAAITRSYNERDQMLESF